MSGGHEQAALLPIQANAPEQRRLPAIPAYGTFRTPTGKMNGLWAMPRPLTKHWGHGRELLERMASLWGFPDVIFGCQDQVGGFFTVDMDATQRPSVVADWAALPFAPGSFRFGYWDPPYLGHVGPDADVHYDRMDPCFREIVRVVSDRIVILSPLVYPCPKGWEREAVVGITYGPNKVIRALQSFTRRGQQRWED